MQFAPDVPCTRKRFLLGAYNLKILARWQDRGDIGPVEMGEAIRLSASQMFAPDDR